MSAGVVFGRESLLKRLHSAEQRARDLLMEVHKKDQMLAKLHSELICEFDSTAKRSFQIDAKSEQRMRHVSNGLVEETWSQTNHFECKYHDDNLLDSIRTLETELENSTNECDSLKTFAHDLQLKCAALESASFSQETAIQNLQRKLSDFESVSLSKQTERQQIDSEMTSILLSLGADGVQSALEITSQLKLQVGSYQAILENLGVSCCSDAVSAIHEMRLNAQSQTVRLQAKEDKEAARREGILRRVCRLWTNRGVVVAWNRWADFVVQRARAKHICTKVIHRIQNLKIASVFDVWSMAVSVRMRQKAVMTRVVMRLKANGASQSFERWAEAAAEQREERAAAEARKATEAEEAASREEILQRVFRVRANHLFSVAWKRWVDYVEQRTMAKDICSKVIRLMRNSYVFEAWSTLVLVRNRKKSGTARGDFAVKKTHLIILTSALGYWRFYVTKVSETKFVAQLCSLQSNYDEIARINFEQSAKIEAMHSELHSRSILAHAFRLWIHNASRSVHFAQMSSLQSDYDRIAKINTENTATLEMARSHIAEANTIRERLQLDAIAEKAEHDVIKLNFQLLNKHKAECEEKHSLYIEQQSNNFKECISAMTQESELSKRRALELEDELQQVQHAKSTMEVFAEQLQLQVSELLRSQEENNMKQSNTVRESDEKMHEVQSRLQAALLSNRDLLMENVDLKVHIEQQRRAAVDQDTISSVLQSKSIEMENKIQSLCDIIQKMKTDIASHISAVSILIHESSSDDCSSTQTKVSTLEEVYQCILQFKNFGALRTKDLKNQQSEHINNLKAEQSFLKDRYVHDCRILHIRLEEQSQVLKKTVEECATLRVSYENDMEEVSSLTAVLKHSITSLEFQLAKAQSLMQNLLRSELLEAINLAVTGSKIVNRSDLVTAFWNEKPETRLQLLNWFSESR